MTFLLISFIAGVLTVLAPCILPLLPVVVGASASARSRATPYIVVGSLALSIIVFTYLLKASTALVMIPQEVWSYLSGGILTLFGLSLVFPQLWESIPGLSRLSSGSNQLLGAGYQKKSVWGDVIVGAALGPVFSTCSPTYFVILASVLPVSFAKGTLYLLAYVIGLSLVLLLVALLGERFVGRLSALSDPRGIAKRLIGVLFVVIGLAIITGYEKKLETAILTGGYFDVTKVEQVLLSNNQSQSGVPSTPLGSYHEIVNPSGFIHTDPFMLKDLVGSKVILLDFMTYSCINCQRTFPYLNTWYDKYKDDGLVIIGIHTPEFAFEHDIGNVRTAMERFGITFPIVLDNDYATWRAYGNRFWPHKYLIDIQGNIIYDHVGEGGYDDTEMKIREALMDRAVRLGTQVSFGTDLSSRAVVARTGIAKSPETYFGARRNEYLGNGDTHQEGKQQYILPADTQSNTLYLGGMWEVNPEYAEGGVGSEVRYRYEARDVYLVARGSPEAVVAVFIDGMPIDTMRGADVNDQGEIMIEASRLYTLVHQDTVGTHTLELRVMSGVVQLFTFTFG